MFKGIEFFKGKSRGEGFVLLRRYTPRNDVCSAGRSMIEMLGVLAIIAVLSVGGIAGYSKAMEKFKVNKLIGEYNMLVFGIMEHKENIMNTDENLLNLIQLVKQLNIVPETWKIVGGRLDDGFGNLVFPYFAKKGLWNIDKDRFAIDLNLGVCQQMLRV